MQEIIKKRIQASIDVKQQILNDNILLNAINDASKIITHCFQQNGKVFFCGNGGSAADAQHLAAEFSGKFYIDRKVLPSEALHCNTSYLTAVSNDYDFSIVYSRLISGIATKGDILIGLSTSGNSLNIVKAFECAREMEVTTIGFTGQDGGVMKDFSDFLINIPSNDTPRIQESHITIGHIICEIVENNIFG